MSRQGGFFPRVIPFVVLACFFSLNSKSASAEDMQVNTYTTLDQCCPSLAFSPDGGFVVIWQSYGSFDTDVSNFSVQGQRFSSDGTGIGSEFQVNTYTTDIQGRASVASDGTGQFVVVWDSAGSAGTDQSFLSIQGRRYRSDGQPIGDPFQANTYTTSSQRFASVGMSSDGGFVVVWHSRDPIDHGDPFAFWSVQAQRYGSDGSPAGGEFTVNTYTRDDSWAPKVAMSSDGRFVVVWESDGSDGTDTMDSSSIQARRFDSDGSPIGEQFQINAYSTGHQVDPSIAFTPSHGFVVVWSSDGSASTDFDQYSIQSRRFDSQGLPVGVELQVNTYTTGDQSVPVVSTDPEGGFAVIWRSDGSPGSDSVGDFSIQARRFDSNGTPLGDPFQINSYTTNNQAQPSIALGPQGQLLAAWSSAGSAGTDTELSSVQRSEVLPSPIIFADGFESGDTSGWNE